MLRRAPDPFVQFVPEGLHKGGSFFIDPEAFLRGDYVLPKPDSSESTFERLECADFQRIQALQQDIKADRDRSYQPFLAEILADHSA